MPLMDLKHLLTRAYSVLEIAFVTIHVSEPNRRTDFTLVLNISSLVFLDITCNLHKGVSIANAALASPLLPCISGQIHYPC